MRVQIIDNVSREMVSVLLPAIEQSKDVRIAVAFVSRRGLAMIEPSIRAALQAGAYLEFLVGLDMRSTEPEALQTLYDLSCKSATVELYCYASLRPAAIYHPKLYVLRIDNEVTSIIGSSNLTEGGLKKNIEVNVVIKASMGDEVVSDVYGIYNQLKFDPKRVVPDDEFLALYAQLCEREREQQRKAVRDKSSRDLVRSFKEKASSLRRPTPSRIDLVGWLELVYDSLPEGEFTNQQVYEYEREFQQHYPENRNIRAKIRQQLQILRDMGLIEHLGIGRWQKV